MTLKNIALVSAFLIILGVLYWRIGVRGSRLDVSRNDTHFPTVSGSNLLRQELTLPADFIGELNIVFVPFLQEQQKVVDTWVEFAQEAEASYPNVAYYELPTIDQMAMVGRTFVNEGMRAGIPDPTSRERTVTLYLDTDKFMQAAAIPNKQNVHTLLVNRAGDILWRTTGVYDTDKGIGLAQAIEANR